MRTSLFSILLCALALVIPGIAAPVPFVRPASRVPPTASLAASPRAADTGPYVNPAHSGQVVSQATLRSAPPQNDAARHYRFARHSSTGDIVLDTTLSVGALGTTVGAIVMSRKQDAAEEKLIENEATHALRLSKIREALGGPDIKQKVEEILDEAPKLIKRRS